MFDKGTQWFFFGISVPVAFECATVLIYLNQVMDLNSNNIMKVES